MDALFMTELNKMLSEHGSFDTNTDDTWSMGQIRTDMWAAYHRAMNLAANTATLTFHGAPPEVEYYE